MDEFSNSIEDFKDIYQEELNNSETNYFILDTHGNYEDEKDFNSYIWETNRYNLVREGDLFIYRRPTKSSEIPKEFYFFGAGKIKKIEVLEGHKVKAIIEKPLKFKDLVLKRDVENINWEFKEKKRKDWQHFFAQYGMNKVSRKDFLTLLSISGETGEAQKESTSENNIASDYELEKQMAEKVANGDYEVEGKRVSVKVRGSAQNVFAKEVKRHYQYKCAITGIETKSFLIASHIVPWSENEKIRIDPSNGICLSSLVDKAFDQGYITISDDYKVLLSDELKKDKLLYEELKKYENKLINLPTKYKPNLKYLDWHRKHIFKK